MKAQTASGSSSGSSTAAATPDTASIADSDTQTEGTTINGSEVQPSNASVKSTSSKGKGKVAEPSLEASVKDVKSTSSTDNLVGKLNNLITTDLQNIVEGRDFCMLSTELISEA